MLKSDKTTRTLYERFWDWIVPETPAEREFWLSEAALLREHARALASVAEREELKNQRRLANDPTEIARLAKLKAFRTVAYSTIHAKLKETPITITVNLQTNDLKERTVDYQTYNEKGHKVEDVACEDFVKGQEVYRRYIGPWVEGTLELSDFKSSHNYMIPQIMIIKDKA